MNTSDKIFSTGRPETKKVARGRQALVGATALATLGLGAAILTDSDEARPTRAVTVTEGATVRSYAVPVSESLNVDVNDVTQDIIDESPDAQDGVIHPGDTLQVPLTDEQIAQQESQTDTIRE